MKIISWNIQNIAESKTITHRGRYQFSLNFSRLGMGNNLLDYVSRVVTGDPVWNDLQSDAPADVFVIIEVKCAGTNRGKYAFGSCQIVLPRFVAAMNNLIQARDLQDTYEYQFVPPLIVGDNETIGVIYNSRRLTHAHSAVLRNNRWNSWPGRKSPFMAMFQTHHDEVGPYLSICGIHAPTALPEKSNNRFAAPVRFALELGETDAKNQENCMIMGDFNCNPSEYVFNRQGDRMHPLDNLPGFFTPMDDETFLSSFKKSLQGSYPFRPYQYLANAFDNIVRNVPLPMAEVMVMDLLMHARDNSRFDTPPAMKGHGRAVFNANRKVSDHLPVMIEF